MVHNAMIIITCYLSFMKTISNSRTSLHGQAVDKLYNGTNEHVHNMSTACLQLVRCKFAKNGQKTAEPNILTCQDVGLCRVLEDHIFGGFCMIWVFLWGIRDSADSEDAWN